jgi:surfeit locus 1 family protein
MKRRLFAGALLTLALVFLALGVWQVERRAWKLRLIAQVEARIHAPATPLDSFTGLGPDDAYRRVVVRGVLLKDRETRVQALTEQGAGWWVMTPLQTAAGTILVNRGFTPAEGGPTAHGSRAAPPGPVTIVGLIRASEPHGGFLRANQPAAGRWYSRDVQAIGRARGMRRLAPVFIDADATPNPGGYPLGGLTVVRFRNAHLAYALTWFALAGLSLYGAVLVLRRREAG